MIDDEPSLEKYAWLRLPLRLAREVTHWDADVTVPPPTMTSYSLVVLAGALAAA
jgi:hypothetical protein